MIPQTSIIEWREIAPWKTVSMVEQDLIISRAAIDIFNDPILSQKVAFRGGTALHKLFLPPAARYEFNNWLANEGLTTIINGFRL